MGKHAALVTGAGHGLGQAIAVALAKEGYHVFGGDLSSDELKNTEDLCIGHDGTFQGAVFDVTEATEWEQWTKSILQSESRIEILVNNAGGVAGQVHQSVEQVSDQDWDRVIRINLYAANDEGLSRDLGTGGCNACCADGTGECHINGSP